MGDLAYVPLVGAFFAAMVALVRYFDQVIGPEEDADRVEPTHDAAATPSEP